MKDLHSIPQLKDSISYIYVEHAKIEQENSSIIILNKEGKTPIPVCYMTCLLIGEGTSITHQAIKVLSESGCLIVWCTDGISNFYAFGHGETHSSKNLIVQVDCYSNHRLDVVTEMYKMRFTDMQLPNMNLNQLRGLEGVRMKSIYKSMSKMYGVPWHGRQYDKKDPTNTDIVNQSLTIANYILYNVCYASLISLGYSPALGFIHTGNQLSFVFDVADLYKAQTTIPTSFEVAKFSPSNQDVPSLTRNILRKYFTTINLLKKIPSDLNSLFSMSHQSTDVVTDDMLWNGNNFVPQGLNYGKLYSELGVTL